MFERFLCDMIYTTDNRLEIQELICQDRYEAIEWLQNHFLELHFERQNQPDILCLRRDQEVIARWETHFDALT